MTKTPRSATLAPKGDIEAIIGLGAELQDIATTHGIHNVFDDGGYKELILLTLFNLRKLHREGDDAEGPNGDRYEIKTVARMGSEGKLKRSLGVTTEHTLTRANVERYRQVKLWIIAVFNQSKPEAIYEITPAALEPFFAKWDAILIEQERVAPDEGGAPPHINNPKIPLGFIQGHGVRIWPPTPEVPLSEEVREGLAKAEAELEPSRHEAVARQARKEGRGPTRAKQRRFDY